jgi:hypothetical protein
VLQRILHEIVDFFRKQLNVRLGLQVFYGLHVRGGAVAARFGEQRNIVAAPLIAVGAAQIDDTPSDAVRVRGIGEVGACRDHVRSGNLEKPLARAIGDKENLHGSAARRRMDHEQVGIVRHDPEQHGADRTVDADPVFVRRPVGVRLIRVDDQHAPPSRVIARDQHEVT